MGCRSTKIATLPTLNLLFTQGLYCCLTEDPFVQVIVGLGLPVAIHSSVIMFPSSTVTVGGDFSVILGATED